MGSGLVAILVLAAIFADLLFVLKVWTFLPPAAPRRHGAFWPISNFTRIWLLSSLVLLALHLPTTCAWSRFGCHFAVEDRGLSLVCRCPDLGTADTDWLVAIRQTAMCLVAGLPFSATRALVTEILARRKASPLPPDAAKG